jgi:hypothetical protein
LTPVEPGTPILARGALRSSSVRAAVLVILSLATCSPVADRTKPPAASAGTSAPRTSSDPAVEGWWCYAGRYPGAERTSSRCMRGEDECNRWLAEARTDRYEADTDRCFRLELAHCTALPSGGDLCRANAAHCDAARSILEARPGRRAEVPPCEERR